LISSRSARFSPEAIGTFYPEGKGLATIDILRAGGVGYVPFATGHYIENTGAGPLRFLEIFRSDRYADLSLNQWLAATPRSLVGAYLRISTEVIAALPATKKPDTAWVAIVMGRQEQSRSLPVAL
jgi:oxalate decarboxylase/phosphoglucose isomerase-like protein (cupin superfamily)